MIPGIVLDFNHSKVGNMRETKDNANIVFELLVCISNRMDESAIWEKMYMLEFNEVTSSYLEPEVDTITIPQQQ